jgi:hypothetical protein
MGKALDQLRAAAAEVRARAAEAAERERERKAAERNVDPADGAAERNVDPASGTAARNGVGVAAGGAVRRASAVAGKVPMMASYSDSLQVRCGVLVLADRAAKDHGNPMVHLWLAEALAAMAKQRKAMDAMRSVGNPSLLAVRAVARIGVVKRDPVAEALGRAHGLAVARLRADKRNSEALQVVARVYLARSQPDKAVAPARLAATAGSGFARGAAFAALASAYLKLGQDDLARKAATAAIKSDCSVGWLTVAALVRPPADEDSVPSSMSRDIVATFRKSAEAQSRVTDDDRERYHGFAPPSEIDVLRGTFALQRTKLTDGVSQLRRGFGRLAAPKPAGPDGAVAGPAAPEGSSPFA